MTRVGEVNPITQSFVGVLRFPDTRPGGVVQFQVPFDYSFCMEIFGEPSKTKCDLTAGGLTVVRTGAVIPSKFTFDGWRFAVTADGRQTVAEAVDKVWNRLLKVEEVTGMSACGFNFELEMELLGEEDTRKWLADRFLSAGAKVASDSGLHAQGIQMGITHPADGRVETVRLEPRAGKPAFLFAFVGNHVPDPEAEGAPGALMQLVPGWLFGKLEEYSSKSRKLLIQLLDLKD